MGKFDGILFCTDLDGTLLKHDKTISSENREAIEFFKREGGSFTFVTGRMPYYSMDSYRQVNPNVPFGCSNGGAVYDGATGKYIWTQAIDPSVLEMVRCIDERFPNVGIQVCSFHATYFCKENDTMVHFREVTKLPNIVRDYRTVTEPFGKIIFGSEENETILAIEKTLREHPLAERFDFVRSTHSLFEILPRGIDKGVALAKLVEYLKIDPRKTIAIGDYNNDVGMLRAAGLGVAVANACKEAKDAADVVTVSNEQHAIAQVIYDLESGKYAL